MLFEITPSLPLHAQWEQLISSCQPVKLCEEVRKTIVSVLKARYWPENPLRKGSQFCFTNILRYLACFSAHVSTSLTCEIWQGFYFLSSVYPLPVHSRWRGTTLPMVDTKNSTRSSSNYANSIAVDNASCRGIIVPYYAITCILNLYFNSHATAFCDVGVL